MGFRMWPPYSRNTPDHQPLMDENIIAPSMQIMLPNESFVYLLFIQIEYIANK